MNNHRFLFFIFLLAMLFGVGLRAQNKISNIDFRHQYHMDGLRGDIICAKLDSTAFFLVQFTAPYEDIKSYILSYSLFNSTSDEINSFYNLGILSNYFQFEDFHGSQYGLQLKVYDNKYIALWLTDTTSNITYPYFSEINALQESNGLALNRGNLNTTLFEHYKEMGSTIGFNNQVNQGDSVLVDFYDYHFLPARPPMSHYRDTLKVPFNEDETIGLSTRGTFNLSQKGLYYFHLPGQTYGYPLLSTEKFYPKFTSIEKLVESLRYIATNSEYEKMTTSFQKKDLFDEFWLNNTKSPERAKITIKEYYVRIREANLLFTNYKEGWKTDMGMIYIIFGAPSSVFYNDGDIMWIYNKTFELPRTAFSFKQIESKFPGQEYILERKPEFENLWFRTVSLWRTGKKEF